jgi:hypothetical protein
MPRPSIFACQYFLGPTSARPRSDQVAHLTGSSGQYTYLHPHLRRQTHEVNTLDILPLEAGAFTSWIGVIWTLLGCTP